MALERCVLTTLTISITLNSGMPGKFWNNNNNNKTCWKKKSRFFGQSLLTPIETVPWLLTLIAFLSSHLLRFPGTFNTDDSASSMNQALESLPCHLGTIPVPYSHAGCSNRVVLCHHGLAIQLIHSKVTYSFHKHALRTRHWRINNESFLTTWNL